MKTSALESKTVRPGAMRYAFYASDRRPASRPKAKPKQRGHRFLGFLILVLIVAGGAAYAFRPATTKINQTATTVKAATQTTLKATPPSAAPLVTATPSATNYCSGNTLTNFIKVSISARHLWACAGTQDVYDTPVVTGIEYLAADKTPVGTYHIYGKYTDTTLKGCDTTGCWNDPVSYWMPFLHNQYGSYGLHDATWRSPSDFGNIDPNSAKASHGCVELPLGAVQWLYNWAPIGTTVTVET